MQISYIPVALDELQKGIRSVVGNITDWHYRTAIYQAPGHYDFLTDWQQINPGEVWGKGNITGFFAHPGIVVPEATSGKQVGLEISIDGEGVLLLNGRYHHGIDRNRSFIPLLDDCDTGAPLKLEMEVAGRINANDPINDIAKQIFTFRHARLMAIDKVVEALWFDLQLGWDASNVIEHEDVKQALLYALYQASIELDFRDMRSPAFIASVAKASEIYHRLLSQIDFGRSGGRLHLMGHAHIDVAWKWQLKETVRKCSRTFSTAVTLMDEFPHYKFTCSQAQLFEYAKQHYPDLYARIKAKVSAGQWEPTGSTWVEMDCNIPSGESLVRQFLYGKRFFQTEFGVETHVLWLPDVFGYSAALPQIMKRAGVDYFLTNKLRWNDTNYFPHSIFQWEGIDGSRVLAHIPPAHGYNGRMDVKQLHDQWRNFSPKHLTRDVAYTYGHGDGGGGVTREMLERATRLQDFPGLPHCTPDTARNFFASIDPVMQQLPLWQGELYFEFHRGTYTTQARTKWFNRKSEILYREAELWASLAQLTAGAKYPQETLHDGWKTILLNQFHDIIPGSSIAEVYADAAEQYQQIMTTGASALQSSFEAIAVRVQVDTAAAHPEAAGQLLVVFNSRSWMSTDVAEVALPGDYAESAYSYWHVRDSQSAVMPSQIIRESNGAKLVFLACEVPAMGYKTFFLMRGAAPIDMPPLAVISAGQDGSLHKVETAMYRLEFSATGRLQGIYDKEQQRDVTVANTVANDWQLFEDRPGHHPAWDIEPHYQDKPLGTEAISHLQLVENGPVCAIIRCAKQIGNACFTQDIILYTHTRRIDFRTCGEWQEREALLKVAFAVQVRASHATYEIAYGAAERSTHTNTSWERAQFEVSGHKWADLSEGNYGVSLLNDCKYGYDIRENLMRLTLLRAPVFPDPHADVGYHEFTYALYPHEGSWREGGTVKEAYSLNQPFVALRAQHGTDAVNLPLQQSIVTSNMDNAVVEVVKAAEDQPEALIVRVFEAYGQRGCVKLTFLGTLMAATECDLLERSIQPVEHTGSVLSFYIAPFEIRTFKIEFASPWQASR